MLHVKYSLQIMTSLTDVAAETVNVMACKIFRPQPGWLQDIAAFFNSRFTAGISKMGAKAKAYNTYTASQLQLQWRFCVTDTAGVQPIGRRLSVRPRTMTCNRTAMRRPGLPFNGLHPRNPCKYIGLLLICRPRRDGKLSWRGWLTHIGKFTHKVVTWSP